MSDTPDPITDRTIEHELRAMTEPSTEPSELWRDALKQTRSAPARGTRRIPGRRRLLARTGLAAAILAVGIGLTVLVNELAIGDRAAARAIVQLGSDYGDRLALADQLNTMLTSEGSDIGRASVITADERLGLGAGGSRTLDRSRPLALASDEREKRIRSETTILRDQALSSTAPTPTAARTGQGSDGDAPTEADAMEDVAAIAQMAPPVRTVEPMLERAADLRLSAEDVDEAATQAALLLDSALGEYVVLSRITGNNKARRAALSLHIASDRFDRVVESLTGLGTIVEIESTTTDLSAEAEAVRDELRLAIQTEQDVLERFENLSSPLATNTFNARRQITDVRRQVNTLEARLRAIEARAQWSMVRALIVSAEPESMEASTFLGEFGSSAVDGLATLRSVSLWLTSTLIASLPIIAIVGLTVWLVTRFLRRSVGQR
ncbi:MAG: DUF4349 domain-containing protein [Planctomycetota bacterium]